MATLYVSDKTRNALLHAVEVQIDILNDTLFESFPFRVTEMRELASLSDEELDVALKQMHKEANEKFDNLVELQKLYAELTKENS